MPVGQRRLEEFGAAGRRDAVPEPSVAVRPTRPAALPGTWAVEEGFVAHPLLAVGVIRALPFQLDFARIGLSEDLLVVLPTGLGKTVIAALLGAEMLRRDIGRILFLAPTRPLVVQHAGAFANWLPGVPRAIFTGTIKKPVRAGGWEKAEAVFATPQIVARDLADGRYDLKGVGLLVVDEAHHAVGKYDYVAIAARFRSERPAGARLLGLTASPGGQDARIEEVVGALGVRRIEARSREDPGVREFVQEVAVETVWVDLSPTALRIRELLKAAHHAEGHALQKMGFLRKKPLTSLSIKDLLTLRAEIFARPGPMTRKFGPLFHQVVLLHLHHALERLETQGMEPFAQYVERVRGKEKPGRGDRAFLAREEVVEGAKIAVRHRTETREASHPKLNALVDLVRTEIAKPRDRPLRILVFAQYRDTIQGIQT
ncbi:MAG: DEAD/DEAH box helicase family protein, partial [Thermoplasmata archaeon]|nr:DEAD/DEAH box helicase family protein [Thermoplasmata archaeon]